jgi:DNA-binding transcriptional LysR family regulator
MAKLDDVLTFVKVADFESISRAARSLGMPISTVSRRLSVLESQLGVSLLRRTTRRVTLTAQGREYLNQCRGPLALLEDAERALTLGQARPEGLVRMSVPVILGQEPFLNFLSKFLKSQPQIRVELFITNIFLVGRLERGCHSPREERSLRRGRRRISERPKAACRACRPAAAALRDAQRQEQRNRLGPGQRSKEGTYPRFRTDIESRLQFGQHFRVPRSWNRAATLDLL